MSGTLSFSPTNSSDAAPKIYSTVSDALTSLNFEVSDDTNDRFVFRINYCSDTNTTNRERFTIDWKNVISKAPITAPSFIGNASTATKLTSSAGNAALPIYFSDGKPVACIASSVFSNLSSSAATNLSVTVAGQNRTIANLYARYLSNNFTSRPTSMNMCYGDGTLRYFLATSTTTTSKPEDDSHILHFSWDNDAGWDSQLSIPTTTTKHVQWRTISGKDSNGNYIYNAWKTLANITDNVASATNAYHLRINSANTWSTWNWSG